MCTWHNLMVLHQIKQIKCAIFKDPFKDLNKHQGVGIFILIRESKSLEEDESYVYKKYSKNDWHTVQWCVLKYIIWETIHWQDNSSCVSL